MVGYIIIAIKLPLSAVTMRSHAEPICLDRANYSQDKRQRPDKAQMIIGWRGGGGGVVVFGSRDYFQQNFSEDISVYI